MSPFETLLAGVWLLVGLLVLCVTLVYIWSRRTKRWRDARWWVVLLFALGVTGVASSLASLLILPSAPTPEERADYAVPLLSGVLIAGTAWVLNNRKRAKADRATQAAIHERQQSRACR